MWANCSLLRMVAGCSCRELRELTRCSCPVNSEGWPAVRSRTAHRLETVDCWTQHREFESHWFCVRHWTQRDFRMPMVSCWCRNPAVDSWLRSDAAELRHPAQVVAVANLREGLSDFRAVCCRTSVVPEEQNPREFWWSSGRDDWRMSGRTLRFAGDRRAVWRASGCLIRWWSFRTVTVRRLPAEKSAEPVRRFVVVVRGDPAAVVPASRDPAPIARGLSHPAVRLRCAGSVPRCVRRFREEGDCHGLRCDRKRCHRVSGGVVPVEIPRSLPSVSRNRRRKRPSGILRVAVVDR